MKTIFETIEKYYHGCLKGNNLEHTLFAPHFSFKGPLQQFTDVESFLKAVKQNSSEVTTIDIKAKFINTQQDQACTLIHVKTKASLEAITAIAEFFTFENGKIKAIEAIYDTRPWDKRL